MLSGGSGVLGIRRRRRRCTIDATEVFCPTQRDPLGQPQNVPRGRRGPFVCSALHHTVTPPCPPPSPHLSSARLALRSFNRVLFGFSFLCLPSSQMQCLITLPSLNVVFSTERLAEDSLKDAGTWFVCVRACVSVCECVRAPVRLQSLSSLTALFLPPTPPLRGETHWTAFPARWNDRQRRLGRSRLRRWSQRHGHAQR